MLLENILPWIPIALPELIIHITAGLGAILMTYSIFLELERRQDLALCLGATCLLIYSIFIGNKLFSVAMLGLAVASLVEYIEIRLGHHHHSEKDLEKYQELK
ncbi:MAG TPA: hypothetical protein PLV72_02320 [Candidatus Magasanikbacteria bacterium]|nr:hypothetical protein [Candidatus Magasanikbacteria bacterium]